MHPPHLPQCRPDATFRADHPSPAPPRTPPDRDAQGRFVRGNAGGPGNPFARRVAALRSALLRRVTEEDIAQIAEDLLVQAKAGNLAATKLLFLYVLGKPGEAVDPDTVDVQEWEQLYRPLARIAHELPPVMAALPAGTACAMAQAAHPFVAAGLAEILRLPQEEVERIAKGAPREGNGGQGAGDGTKAAHEPPQPPSPNRDFFRRVHLTLLP